LLKVVPKFLAAAGVLTAVLSLPRPAGAQSPGPNPNPNPRPDPTPSNNQPFKGLSIEDLSKIDVTSVSKHAEIVSEAAAAISVITAEDLRRSGVTELAEAMRLAVGMVVARFNGETWGVSARGFNISTANKMLVLIDGRSVYTPLYSGVFWGVQDVVFEDVERIEVVRGPGGTLWGANAVNGVINIITKTSADTQGTLVTTGAGSRLGQTVLRYGGKAGLNASYRIYTKYSYFGPQVFSSGANAHDRLGRGQAGFRMDWTPPSRSAFTVQADAYDAKSGLSDRPDIDESGGNLLGRFSHTSANGAQLQFQVYYDGTYRKVPRQFSEHRDTGDLDFQYRIGAGRHDITTGVGYRLTNGRAPASAVLFFDPPSRTSHLLNAFVQDEITLLPRTLTATLGSKIEHNDFTGVEYQPTGRLRWSPSARQTVWGAVSRAVRMPTRFDSDLRFTSGFPIVVLQGSSDFASETVVAGEAGYRHRVANRVSLDVAAFVNGYDDLRTQEPSTAPGGLPITLGNNLQATTRGVEVGVDYQPASFWQLHGAYTRLSEDFQPTAESRDPGNGSAEHNDPRDQMFVRSYLDLPSRGEVDAIFRFVGALPQPKVARYAELTLRVGWGHQGPMELSVTGDNLLHGRHGEAAATGPVQEQYVRRVTARAMWRF
jgi:iron complex outermembrane receptor protein